MPKFSVHCSNWSATFTKDDFAILDKAAKLGYDGVEIGLIPSVVKGLPVKDAVKKFEDCGLKASFDTALDPDQDISSGNAGFRTKGVDHLLRCLDIVAEFGGNELGGMTYGVWGGFSGYPPTTAELLRSAESLRIAAEYARPLGIDIAIEPLCRFEGYLIPTAEAGLEYLEMVGMRNVGLHLDTFQMNIEEKSLPAAIRLAGSRLVHFHLCASDRGIPGEDHIDWPGVFGALKQVGYDRWITVEAISPDSGENALAAKVWRRVGEPYEIAAGGLALLRNHFIS